MKTKEEVIKESWGNNIPNGGIDENGWSKLPYRPELIDYENYDAQQYIEGGYIRPKSLKGIEDNNGWIKIESEKHLPNKDGYEREYWIANENGVFDFIATGWQINKKFENKTITHYKPIIKLLKPLY